MERIPPSQKSRESLCPYLEEGLESEESPTEALA